MRYQNVEIHNAVERILPEKGEGFYFSRIPESVREHLNAGAQDRALWTAGSEIRCILKDGSLRIILENETPLVSIAEIYYGPFFHSFQSLEYGKQSEILVEKPKNIHLLREIAEKENSPFDPEVVRVLLPYTGRIRFYAIFVEGSAELPNPNQVPSRICLMYGSSITHGQTGLTATGGYAMQTARRLGIDLFNLGFGSGAHCEVEIAEYISDRDDWDFAFFELGINMVYTFEPDEFNRRIRFFLGRIAKAHKEKWVFCTDLFRFSGDFFSPSHPGMEKQNEFRQIVAAAVEDLSLPKLLYFDGRDLLPSYLGLGEDMIHPSPFGMQMISEILAKEIQKALAKE
jgi:lysophospholipase L1-like esterase